MKMEFESENGEPRVGRYDSISQAFAENPWMFKFISGICDYYGMPSTSGECSSQRERLMYAWAVASVISALGTYKVLWISGFETYNLKLLIPNFIESYRELTGREVIPPLDTMPSA